MSEFAAAVAELDSAFEVMWLATGNCPRRYVIAREASVIGELAVGEVFVWERVWRDAVERFLDTVWGGEVPEGQVEVTMRRDGWRYRGVPVDTSRLRA